MYYVVLSQFPLAGYVFVVVGGREGGGGRVGGFRIYCKTMQIKCKFCMCSVSDSYVFCHYI